MEGVILSHTAMATGFCTSLGVRTKKGWRQIRPLMQGGLHLTAESVGLSQADLLEQWVPGRVVSFELARCQDPPRPTHPEDRTILPGSLRLEDGFDLKAYQLVVEQATYPDIRDLYPKLVVKDGKAFVLGNQKLSVSIGYVRCFWLGLNPMEQRVVLQTAPNRPKLNVKLTDVHLQERFRRGEFHFGQEFRDKLVRLSLANPWSQYRPPRCYLMLSHLALPD